MRRCMNLQHDELSRSASPRLGRGLGEGAPPLQRVIKAREQM